MRRRQALGALACGLLGAPAATPAESPGVSIAFVGDVMLDEGPGRLVRRGQDPLARFAQQLASADIRVANLECVVATTGRAEPGKPYTFRAHPRVLGPLKRHFDAVALANNHSGDFGPQAFAEMLGLLDKAGLAYFGGGRTLAEAHRPLVIERQGLRIALLGYNGFFPRSFEADHDKPGIAWNDEAQVLWDIRQARLTHRADLVIPMMHWGVEHEPLANQGQRRLARLMVEAGADAVVGGHPHVLQDTETHQGKPIFYSLGNFVFDGFSDADNNTGWLLRLEVNRQGVTGWTTERARIDKQGMPHPAGPGPRAGHP